jgi:hypothetical protein
MTLMATTEARKTRRRQILDTALIRSGDMSMSCVLRNWSEAGATLDVGVQAEIPDRFTLILVSKKKIYSCTMVWRKGGRIGVSFF